MIGTLAALAGDRLQLRQFLRFFTGSAAGLAIDLGGVAALTLGGVQPVLANLCSSFASITAVCPLVTRYAFGVGARPRTYVAFLIWYSSSIFVFVFVFVFVFAIAIGLATGASGLPAIVCKLASVPVSFGLNFAFSRWLFRA